MLEQIMLYYGAVCGVLSAVAFLLHAFKLDETKYGKLFCKAANDVAGLYKGLSSAKSK